MSRVRLARMCGGGIPVLRRRFWWRYPGYRINPADLLPRRAPNALIWDWPGLGLFWG